MFILESCAEGLSSGVIRIGGDAEAQEFKERRDAFGVNRKSGARKLVGGIGGLLHGLRALRDLRR